MGRAGSGTGLATPPGGPRPLRGPGPPPGKPPRVPSDLRTRQPRGRGRPDAELGRATLPPPPAAEGRAYFLRCRRPRRCCGVPGPFPRPPCRRVCLCARWSGAGGNRGAACRPRRAAGGARSFPEPRRAPLRFRCRSHTQGGDAWPPAPTRFKGLGEAAVGGDGALDEGRGPRQQNLVSLFAAFIGTGYWWHRPVTKCMCPVSS